MAVKQSSELLSGVDPTAPKCTPPELLIELDQIQGNIFGGFLKDHQATFLIEIINVNQALATLKGIYAHVSASSSSRVIAFNEQFKALRKRKTPEGTIIATWTNLVFTARGLKKIGQDISSFPEAFKGGTEGSGEFLGMVGRANEIGDIGSNSPGHWNDGITGESERVDDWTKVHAAVLLASDDASQIDEQGSGRGKMYAAAFQAAGSGLRLIAVIQGATRSDQPGHEHFGFKDGVSQPGIRGVTAPDDPLHNPDQGNPGQDLLYPGEFVLGYPRQIPAPDGTDEGPNPHPGIIAGSEFYTTDPAGSKTILPDWAKNGSFLVFRRLAQDVRGFRKMVEDAAGDLNISPDLMGAKLVGRYASGAPLEPLKFQINDPDYEPPLVDPGIGSPALGNEDAINNDFEYGKDPDGDIVPLAAHVRKAYPRDEPDGDSLVNGSESRTQTHRLLRRGIPFGKSLYAPADGEPDKARGLLFFAYQSDIERQFEFVQTQWVNNPNFPVAGAGQDPIIANNTTAGPIAGCPFHKKLGDPANCPATFQHFVKTRGGQYFFSPAIDVLGKWLGCES